MMTGGSLGMAGSCPVNATEIVDVKFRLHSSINNDTDLAGMYRWNHADKSGVLNGDPNCDIIAYRISKVE